MKKEVKEEKIETEDIKEEELKKGINKVLVCLIILVFLIGIYVVVTKVIKNDARKFKEEYTEVVKDNLFVYKTIEEVIEILEDGTGVIYFGFPECKWCQAYVPMLDEVAKENNVKEIYYLNIRQDRTDNTKEYQKVVELLEDVLDKDDDGNPRVFVPEVVVVVDGEVMGHNNETALITNSELNPKIYWTKEQQEELKSNLQSLISKVNSCIDCN